MLLSRAPKTADTLTNELRTCSIFISEKFSSSDAIVAVRSCNARSRESHSARTCKPAERRRGMQRTQEDTAHWIVAHITPTHDTTEPLLESLQPADKRSS